MDLRIGQRWALQSKNECAMREGQKRKHSMRQELDGAHFSKTLITETRQSRSTTSTYKELDNLEQQLNMCIHNIGTMLGSQYFASIANRGTSCICNITTALWRESLRIVLADIPTTPRKLHTQEYLAITFFHGALAFQNPSSTLTRSRHSSVPCLHTLQPHSSAPKPNKSTTY